MLENFMVVLILYDGKMSLKLFLNLEYDEYFKSSK